MIGWVRFGLYNDICSCYWKQQLYMDLGHVLLEPVSHHVATEYRQGGRWDELPSFVTYKFFDEVVCTYVFFKLMLICIKIRPRYISAPCRNFISGCSLHNHNNSRHFVRCIHNNSRYYVRFSPLAFYYTCIVSYNISIGPLVSSLFSKIIYGDCSFISFWKKLVSVLALFSFPIVSS